MLLDGKNRWLTINCIRLFTLLIPCSNTVRTITITNTNTVNLLAVCWYTWYLLETTLNYVNHNAVFLSLIVLWFMLECLGWDFQIFLNLNSYQTFLLETGRGCGETSVCLYNTLSSPVAMDIIPHNADLRQRQINNGPQAQHISIKSRDTLHQMVYYGNEKRDYAVLMTYLWHIESTLIINPMKRNWFNSLNGSNCLFCMCLNGVSVTSACLTKFFALYLQHDIMQSTHSEGLCSLNLPTPPLSQAKPKLLCELLCVSCKLLKWKHGLQWKGSYQCR